TDIIYVICQIKDCTRKYAHHGSTTNYTKHLCDDHHIIEVSLSSKTPEEIIGTRQPLSIVEIHNSYLDIIAHWINKEFEICNMVLNIGKIPYPHTGIEIALTKLEKDWIPCAAHTLQLLVTKRLKIIDPLITKVKNLIIFLESDKRKQQLRHVQVMCNQIQENETVEIIKPIDIK
ncbi:11948_t:CDS:2, partial [Diversispora eburnea]